MASVLRAAAPAKVNLVLRVGARRRDGYHEVDTLLHALTLADEIAVRPAPRLEVTCEEPRVPSGPANLAYRAARLLASHCGSRAPPGPPAARVQIVKRVPVAAGLGGGSADAAATLRLLNRLWGCGFDLRRLQSLAAELGADVPFCVGGGAARAVGTGDLITSVTALRDVPVVLVCWPRGLTAAEVYGALGEAGGPGLARVEPALVALAAGDLHRLAAALASDLEPVVERLRPETAEARRDLLAHGALGAVVSGSGPTVFGLYADRHRADTAAAALARRWPQVLRSRLGAEGVDRPAPNFTGRG